MAPTKPTAQAAHNGSDPPPRGRASTFQDAPGKVNMEMPRHVRRWGWQTRPRRCRVTLQTRRRLCGVTLQTRRLRATLHARPRGDRTRPLPPRPPLRRPGVTSLDPSLALSLSLSLSRSLALSLSLSLSFFLSLCPSSSIYLSLFISGSLSLLFSLLVSLSPSESGVLA